MNTRYKIALATLAGIGIGAAAIHELHAQAKPPACGGRDPEHKGCRRL